MTREHLAGALNTHYGRHDVAAAILDALHAAGYDTDGLTPADLSQIDQFHSGLRLATVDQMRMAGIEAGMRVLDVGGGLGGPARILAAEAGCHVTVLDLTEAFCRAGQQLTALVGLADLVDFRHGSALDIPFEDARFDVVWSQQSTMNIEDKRRLYREIHRVLRPGGRYAFQEVLAGPVSPAIVPAAWASDASQSFLRSPAETRALIKGAGFAEETWQDVSDEMLALTRRTPPPPPEGKKPLPPLIQVLFGPAAAEIMANSARNQAEHRVAIVRGAFRRTK